VWASRAGYAAALLGAVFFAFSILNPLPDPSVEDAPTPPPSPALAWDDASLEQRRDLLALLTEDNMFHPDRAFWQATPTDPALAEGEDAAPAEDENAPRRPGGAASNSRIATTVDPGAPPDYDSIAVRALNEVTPAVANKVKELILRGVYEDEEGPVAMIGTASQQARRGSLPRRVGDRFDDDNWRVLAIDAEGGRVILERTGEVNIELRLYPEMAYEASWPRAGAASTAQTPDAGIPTASANERADTAARLDEIRRQLEEAGVDQESIEETLSLAQDGELDDASGEDAALAEAGAAPDEQQAEERPTRRGPSGVGPLLRLLSSNPLRPEQPQQTKDESADDESPEDAPSEPPGDDEEGGVDDEPSG
jgi:hypothetical protein